MLKSCKVQWWLWYVDGYDYLGMLRKSARAKEGRRYRAKIVLVFCVCWRSQYWKFNQNDWTRYFFFQTVYGHMEWHADICKSLVYETYKEICCDKTNASPSSTRLEHSESRGLSTHLWYLMEKEIHLLVIQKMRTFTEKFVQKLLTFLWYVDWKCTCY